MSPFTPKFIIFPPVAIESIFDFLSITLNIVVADPRADANDSKYGAVLATLSAPTIKLKNVCDEQNQFKF